MTVDRKNRHAVNGLACNNYASPASYWHSHRPGLIPGFTEQERRRAPSGLTIAGLNPPTCPVHLTIHCHLESGIKLQRNALFHLRYDWMTKKANPHNSATWECRGLLGPDTRHP